MNQKGFGSLRVVLAVMVVLAIGGIWYYKTQQTNNPLSLGNSTTTSPVSASIPPSSETILPNGGTIKLSDGSSVVIPPGILSADETAKLVLSTALPGQPPSGFIVGVGNTLTINFSGPLPQRRLPPTSQELNAPTSTKIKFTINMGTNTLGLEESLPILVLREPTSSPLISKGATSSLLIFVPAAGSYDIKTNQAVIYVDSYFTSGVDQISVSMANTIGASQR